MTGARVSGIVDLRQVPIGDPDAQAADRAGAGGVRRALRRPRRVADRPHRVRRAAGRVLRRPPSTAYPSSPAPGGGAATSSVAGTTNTAEIKRMYVAPAARGARAGPADARPPGGDRARGRRGGDDPGDRAECSPRRSRSTSPRATRRSPASATTGTRRSTAASARRFRRVQPTRRQSSDFLSQFAPTAPSAPLASCRAQGTRGWCWRRRRCACLSCPRPPHATYVLPVEDYASYQPQKTCAPHRQARHRGARPVAGRRAAAPTAGRCAAAGSGGQSEHKDGRAFDWTLDATSIDDEATAQAFLTEASPTTSSATPTRSRGGWGSCTSSGTTGSTPPGTASSRATTSARAAAPARPARRRCATATTCTSR